MSSPAFALPGQNQGDGSLCHSAKITGTVLCVNDTENTHANNGTDREWKGVYKGGAIWYNKRDREREGRFDA